MVLVVPRVIFLQETVQDISRKEQDNNISREKFRDIDFLVLGLKGFKNVFEKKMINNS